MLSSMNLHVVFGEFQSILVASSSGSRLWSMNINRLPRDSSSAREICEKVMSCQRLKGRCVRACDTASTVGSSGYPVYNKADLEL